MVERTYFIQFMFPEETGLKAEDVPIDVQGLVEDMADMATLPGEGGATDRQEEEGDKVTDLIFLCLMLPEKLSKKIKSIDSLLYLNQRPFSYFH